MRLRTLLMSFLALIFAGSSAVGVFLVGASPSGSNEPELTSIVAAKINIPRGATITAEQVHLVPWPKEYVPAGALESLEDAVDRAVAIPLTKDELVTEAKLAAKGAGRGMAALVPPGMRAMTILTPNISTGVAGFVLPGNRVDVLLTLSRVGPDDHTGGGGTITLLQNIEILAVDQRIEVPSENWVDPKELRSVTLLVTPEEASQLDLGQNKGTLSLSLRNPEDGTQTDIKPATLAGLRSHSYFSAHPEYPISGADELLREPASTIVAPPAVAETPPQPMSIEPTIAESEIDKQAPDEPDTEPKQPATKKPARKPAFLAVRTLRGMSGGVTYLRPDEHGSDDK